MEKKLKGSFAPTSFTLCTNLVGFSCSFVHSTDNWQDGTHCPGANWSTWRLIIWKNNSQLGMMVCIVTNVYIGHQLVMRPTRGYIIIQQYPVFEGFHFSLTPGWVSGVIIHPVLRVFPSSGISRVIFQSSNITSWSGPLLAAILAYLESTACNLIGGILWISHMACHECIVILTHWK